MGCGRGSGGVDDCKVGRGEDVKDGGEEGTWDEISIRMMGNRMVVTVFV